MKKKHNHIQEDEIKTKELFSFFSLEEPTGDFTKNTMNKVLQEWTSKPIILSSRYSLKSKLSIGAGSLIAIVLIYLFDIRKTGNASTISESLSLNSTTEAFSDLGHLFAVSFSQIPNLVYIIFIGVSALLFLDKMINKFTKTT
jgi:hypothetical protein